MPYGRAHLGRARMVFTDRAIVRETVPVSRARLSWMLRRSYRAQGSYVSCEREFQPLARWLPVRSIKTLGITTRGIVRILASPLRGRTLLFRGLQDIARAGGAVSGAFSFVTNEYDTIHGR